MKCANCPCSNTIQYFDDCDWECMAGMEDEMYADGCDLTEEEACKRAKDMKDSMMDYWASYVDWLEKEGDKLNEDSD